eukprot:352266-Chlamydomonas_euryale.AAC.2
MSVPGCRLIAPCSRRPPYMWLYKHCACAGGLECCVEIFTFSKSYHVPGLRLGFMLGNADAIAALAGVKAVMDFNQWAGIQRAGIGADGHMLPCGDGGCGCDRPSQPNPTKQNSTEPDRTWDGAAGSVLSS